MRTIVTTEIHDTKKANEKKKASRVKRAKRLVAAVDSTTPETAEGLYVERLRLERKAKATYQNAVLRRKWAEKVHNKHQSNAAKAKKQKELGRAIGVASKFTSDERQAKALASASYVLRSMTAEQREEFFAQYKD